MENHTINDLNYNARRALILGQSGMGKSTLATRLIYSHPAPLKLVYDWDGGEYAHRLGVKPAISRDEIAEKIEAGEELVCYRAELGEEDPTGAGFEWFCDMAFEVSGSTPGRKLFVVDEVHDLIDPWTMPEHLGRILRAGRRRMMDTCLVGEAANAINSVGRNQVSELYLFRNTDDKALEFPKSLKMDVEEIRNLPKTHFIYRDRETGEAKKLALWQNASKEPVKSV